MNEVWDLIVVGGGPAGLMAAGTAAASGLRVLLLEKNTSLGKKLLISGGGRCNFTQAEFDNHRLANRYGKRGRALLSPFRRFSAQDALDFFGQRGMPWKIEAENRAFPASDSSRSVLAVLESYILAGGVQVRTGVEVRGFTRDGDRIRGVRVQGGEIQGHRFVLATGGTSRPETGSTGEGFRWLRALGHQVVLPEPSLVPVAVKEPWVGTLQGLSFPEVRLSVWRQDRKEASQVGKVLFTHFGLSGPLILNWATTLDRLAAEGPVTLSLDFFPKEDSGTLDRRILESLSSHPNRLVRNAWGEVVPPRLAERFLALSGVDGTLVVRQLPRDQRLRLIQTAKDLRLTFSHLLGEDWAVVSSGGVDPGEVDFATMASRLVPNLYLVGDVLDFDRPSGGFSLQICWATGFTAGQSCAADPS